MVYRELFKNVGLVIHLCERQQATQQECRIFSFLFL